MIGIQRYTRALYGALACAFALACAPIPSAVGASTTPTVAPPASPQVAAACARREAAGRATADQVTRVPRGKLTLSGCVSDTSGIAHVVISWNRGSDHARICTDPVVDASGEWTCLWDTTRLPSGGYELELVAIDAAGNQGSSTRKYEIEDRQQVVPDELSNPQQPALPAQPPSTTPVPEEAAPDPVPSPTPSPESEQPPAEASESPEPLATFSALQQMVIDRVTACELGGFDEQSTDDPQIITQQQQVQRVLDCLAPALRLAGADSSEIRDESPLPLAVVVEVSDAAARAELSEALADTIAGVPVLVTEPDPALVQAPDAAESLQP